VALFLLGRQFDVAGGSAHYFGQWSGLGTRSSNLLKPNVVPRVLADSAGGVWSFTASARANICSTYTQVSLNDNEKRSV